MSDRCRTHALLGPQCELNEDHEGPHSHTRRHGPAFLWTDEGTRRAVAEWEAMGGGWD